MTSSDHNATAVAAQMGEASEWLVRLQEDDVTEADVAAWLKWCAADSASLEAFERVQHLYDQLQALSPSEKKPFLKLRSSAISHATGPDILWRALSWSREHALPLVTGVAVASIAVALVAIGQYGRLPLVEAHEYHVGRGAQETLMLADHSHITLASASEILSHFTA